jgi:membrane-bound ClpP family serine protease
MTEEDSMSQRYTGDLHGRALAAASSLRHQATGAATPDLRHLAVVRRVTVGVGLGALGLVAGVVLLLSLVASAALPWVVGVGLVLAVAAVAVLGIHAGGHGWFLPLPVVGLVALWAVTVMAGGSWASPAAWIFAALALASALLAAILFFPAIAFRNMAVPPLGGAALVGASGVAVSPLAPTGIARVNNETWTAESLSGELPAGAPVHVAKVEGLRLLVWSEAGNVPGPEALGSIYQEKEEA